MSRRSRKKKADRRPKRLTVVSPSPKMAQTIPLSAEVTKFQPDGAVLTSKEILVAAPVELCFNILANKLEKLPEWDPTVIYVKPVSEVRRQIGARSEVILSLGGRRLQALAMVYHYQPNRAIGWIITGKPKIKEDWRLEPRPQGTLVGVTVAREVGGRVIVRLLDKIMHQRKVEDDLTKILTRFKVTVEGSSSV